MTDDLAADDPAFSEWLASCLGVSKLAANGDTDLQGLTEWAGNVWELIQYLGSDASQYEQALKLLLLLQPTEVDVDLWKELALQGRASLLSGHQFGHKKSARSGGRQDSEVAEKKDPRTQFIRRQGKAVVAAEAKISRLEAELEEAKVRRAELQNGLQAFATIGLLTQVRKAAAPMFAMGPAWTVLRAIQGSTGREVSDDSRPVETKRILVVLHALRGQVQFEQELKQALLDVCHRWMSEASKRGEPGTEFDGPLEYELILKNLGWPDPKYETDPLAGF